MKHIRDIRDSALKFLAGAASDTDSLMEESCTINRWWGHPPFRDLDHASQAVLMANKFFKRQARGGDENEHNSR